MILGQNDPQRNKLQVLNNNQRTQGQIHGRKDHESAETAETSMRHNSASYGPMAVILHPRVITLHVLSTVGLSLSVLLSVWGQPNVSLCFIFKPTKLNPMGKYAT